MEVGSPPLARGIRLFQFLDRTERGITPACAGNTIIVIQYWKFRLDHPRLRGEYGSRRLYALGFRGSPPLARGILSVGSLILLSSGITPACAGNTNRKSGR